MTNNCKIWKSETFTPIDSFPVLFYICKIFILSFQTYSYNSYLLKSIYLLVFALKIITKV